MALRTPPIGSLFSLALLLVILLPLAHAFYLPGVAPQDFAPGLELQVKVNKLTSTKTQLPYEYYSLDYCSPEKTINSAENLGEVLRGDRIENSRYVFHMKEDKLCNVVCKIDKLSEKAVNSFKKKIEEEYRVNMILDNLPVAMSKPQPRVAGKIIERGWRGFPVGLKGTYTDQTSGEKFFLNNHLSFIVLYHKDPETLMSRIVGFEVTPFSVKHQYEGAWNEERPRLLTCNADSMKYVDSTQPPQEVKVDEEVIFSYDVQFKVLPPASALLRILADIQGLSHNKEIVNGMDDGADIQGLCKWTS